MLSKRMSSWVLPASALSVVIAAGVGLAVDAKGFLVNILAGVVSIIISFAIALAIVDRYVQHHREQQWAKVQTLTLRAIAVHLCEIVGGLFVHFPGLNDRVFQPFWEGHGNPLTTDIRESFAGVLNQLRPLPSGITPDKSTSDIAVEYYESLKWDLDQIQNVLTPRVLQSPVQQSLIDSLVAFDQAHRELRHAMIAHQAAVTHSVFPRVISLIEAARNVYQEILKCSANTPTSESTPLVE